MSREKNWCVEGSGSSDFAERPYDAGFGAKKLAKCRHCGRVLKPTSTGKLRQHQVPGPTTRSMDKTMESLWAYAGILVGATAVGDPCPVCGVRLDPDNPEGWGSGGMDG